MSQGNGSHPHRRSGTVILGSIILDKEALNEVLEILRDVIFTVKCIGDQTGGAGLFRKNERQIS